MIYRDLREWIDRLEKEDELIRLKEEIHLEPDSGAIGRAVLDIDGPGILAERVYGYETKMTTGLFASLRRVSIAMGLPKEAGLKEQKEVVRRAYDRYPVKAKMVAKKDAPCKENIMTGDQVNLFQFPIARNNSQDAGPYIYKTVCITKDPDSDWVNCGVFRMQVLDRNQTGILFQPDQHIADMYRSSLLKGKPLEIAVALGVEPVLMISAATKIPRGWSEFDFAGAMRGEPEELVMAESVELPVPATAEIVIEGVIGKDPHALEEGPFGEGFGAYSSRFTSPIIDVKTITYRNDPIYDTLYIGRPPTESSTTMNMASAVAALEQNLKANFPQITEVAFLYPKFLNTVIQGRWNDRSDPSRAMMAFFGSPAAILQKMVTIVDEDINPWDAADVMWAIATRCQADTDLYIIPGTHVTLDPSREENGLSCRLGIDATKPVTPYRHRLAAWVTPRKGTEAWKGKVMKLWKGGKR